MIKVTAEPIDPSMAYQLIGKGAAGSVVFHYAVVKEDGGTEKQTTCIDYQTNGDTEAELAAIAADVQGKWQLEDVLLIRRSGCLGVGEIISLVAASSPASEDAFEACRYGIARLKKMSTIKKEEKYR